MLLTFIFQVLMGDIVVMVTNEVRGEQGGKVENNVMCLEASQIRLGKYKEGIQKRKREGVTIAIHSEQAWAERERGKQRRLRQRFLDSTHVDA